MCFKCVSSFKFHITIIMDPYTTIFLVSYSLLFDWKQKWTKNFPILITFSSFYILFRNSLLYSIVQTIIETWNMKQ